MQVADQKAFFTIAGEGMVAGEGSSAFLVHDFLRGVSGNESRVVGTSFPFEQC